MPAESKVNILVVDDQPKNLLALEAVLTAPGQNLIEARSGQEALKHLLEHDFALILMDVLMPGMDGFETAALIRQRDKSRRTPIIFLTAAGKSELHIFKGYSVGAVDYLFKPVEPEILRSKVSVFVDLFRKNQEVKRQAEQLRDLERREHERQLAEERQRFESERQHLAMRLAQSIQQKLFPAGAPALPGLDIHGASHPAETMGGDYYDYIPMQDGSLGLVIGDVSGHGFGPALVMAATRAYLHALALTCTDVGEILRLANVALVDDVLEECFVTLLMARLDPRTRSLTYSSAGHPPGCVLSASGEVKHMLDSTSLPLGLDADVDFPAAPEIQLDSGDVVLLLTDGVIERFGPGDELFGMDRAVQVVREHRSKSAAEIVRLLYDAVHRFGMCRNGQDDVSAVVFKLEAR